MAQKKHSRRRARRWWILPVLLLVTAAAAGFFFHVLPRFQAQRSMPLNGTFQLRQQENGSLELRWPAAFDVDFYRLQVLDGETLLWETRVPRPCCTLPELPRDRELTLSADCGVNYRSLGREAFRLGDHPLTVSARLEPPAVTELTWEADPDRKQVWVRYRMAPGDKCLVFSGEDAGQARETDEESLCLSFGGPGQPPVPAPGESVTFHFRACRNLPGLVFEGAPSGALTLTREDLLGRNLNLQFLDLGYNVCSLSWDETKGDAYAVQRREAGTDVWETVATVPADGERSYTSPHLPIYKTYVFRVAATGGEPEEGSEYAALSQEMTLETHESPVFCTVWPGKDLTLYEEPGESRELGTVPQGRALCVLEEQGDWFRVQLGEQSGYIDSRYCLINLPEYLGDLCIYNITNSFDCHYMVHEFEIPDMTGQCLLGYEDIHQADGSCLAPLLYPTAKKLADAGQTALRQGYRLKIYDAFRPRETTDRIFAQTKAILDLPIPEAPYTGVPLDSLNLPRPPENAGEELGPNGLTYKMVMVNELYGLDYFLAAGGSAHNQGLAMDLTMISLETGQEVRMQTSIHDLSRYSVVTDNNSGSQRLAAIMTGAGFGTLVSEWWHFQDNEARKALDPAYVPEGLSGACWMADDQGWRYRTRDGSFYSSCCAVIGTVEYTFDGQGYLTED